MRYYVIVDSSSPTYSYITCPIFCNTIYRMIKKLYDDDCSNVLDKSWDKTVKKDKVSNAFVDLLFYYNISIASQTIFPSLYIKQKGKRSVAHVTGKIASIMNVLKRYV